MLPSSDGLPPQERKKHDRLRPPLGHWCLMVSQRRGVLSWPIPDVPMVQAPAAANNKPSVTPFECLLTIPILLLPGGRISKIRAGPGRSPVWRSTGLGRLLTGEKGHQPRVERQNWPGPMGDLLRNLLHVAQLQTLKRRHATRRLSPSAAKRAEKEVEQPSLGDVMESC